MVRTKTSSDYAAARSLFFHASVETFHDVDESWDEQENAIWSATFQALVKSRRRKQSVLYRLPLTVFGTRKNSVADFLRFKGITEGWSNRRSCLDTF